MLEGRETCDLVDDVAQPVVARVIGSFMGIPPEDDAVWARLMNSTLGAGDPDLSPEGVEGVIEKDVPEIFERCKKLIEERRENPTDDLTSVLVHAEVDGHTLEEHEIVMGFFLLVAAGNDSTKATYCSAMRALMENPDQRQLLLDDMSLVPSAVEEALRMFPAFAHFRRTATRDAVINGQEIKEGDKVVMWYVSSNRDETRYEDPDRFDVTRNPEHQAFGAGGRHFCLGTALARLELNILLEETLQALSGDGDRGRAGVSSSRRSSTSSRRCPSGWASELPSNRPRRPSRRCRAAAPRPRGAGRTGRSSASRSRSSRPTRAALRR